ncbi:MAG: ABC transporter permease, partial [Blastocatellia bacterium]
METLLRDVRYGFRSMKALPSFAGVAILALALGIGACSAIFSVVNAVLLKPLPYSQPDRLMMIWGYSSQGLASGWDVLPASAPNLADWERQNRSFEQIAAFRTWAYNLTGGDRPERYWAARVSVNFFALLGVSPEIGRAFGSGDDQPGASQKVILSDQLWRQRFAGDESVVGQTVQMSGETFTIIGVMPPWFNFPNAAGMPSGFRFAAHTDMWTPLAFTNEDMQNRGTQNLAVLGRLKANVSQAQAQSDMTAITGRLALEYPNENAGYEVKLVPLHRQLTGEVRKPLLILLGAVVFVLLIACSNVANLMLVRAAAREKEIAIRAALGAARARIARQ